MIIYHRIPVLLHVGFFTVYSWGFFVSLGVLTALLLAMKENRNKSQEIINSLIVLIPSALIGARLFYVFSHWDFYSQHLLQILNFPGGGLDLPGALLFGFLAFILYFKIRKLDYKEYLDVFAVYIPLAQAIGRVGCFFNGCCYGSLTNVPWGITYMGGIRHPAQLYESILDLTIFFYLHHLRNKKKIMLFNRNLNLFPGAKFLLYLILYSIVRFICEFFRIEPRVFYGFTVMHIVTFFVILISLFILFKAQPKVSLSKAKGKARQKMASANIKSKINEKRRKSRNKGRSNNTKSRSRWKSSNRKNKLINGRSKSSNTRSRNRKGRH